MTLLTSQDRVGFKARAHPGLHSTRTCLVRLLPHQSGTPEPKSAHRELDRNLVLSHKPTTAQCEVSLSHQYFGVFHSQRFPVFASRVGMLDNCTLSFYSVANVQVTTRPRECVLLGWLIVCFMCYERGRPVPFTSIWITEHLATAPPTSTSLKMKWNAPLASLPKCWTILLNSYSRFCIEMHHLSSFSKISRANVNDDGVFFFYIMSLLARRKTLTRCNFLFHLNCFT